MLENCNHKNVFQRKLKIFLANEVNSPPPPALQNGGFEE